jgi:hypothetical protein
MVSRLRVGKRKYAVAQAAAVLCHSELVTKIKNGYGSKNVR